MVEAIVYALATADGLAPVVGAAPYDVLSRQLPRMLVARLNGDADRGVRFFPLLGKLDGKRGFLRLSAPFEPSQLLELHKQGAAKLVCDGMLRDGELHWRMVDGESGRVLRELDLPFDPAQPTEVLARLEFEVMELLGWTGRPGTATEVEGEALGWFLILKDTLLRLEAGLAEESADPLRGARRCLELAGDHRDTIDLVLDVASHLLRQSARRDEVAVLLRPLVDTPEMPVALFERLGALLLAAGDEGMAATATLRAARSAIERRELVERCVGLLFRLERFEEAAELVELARQRGVASVTALAQYAACCDRIGQAERRAELCDEMLRVHDLPVAVARLLVSFLLEDERADQARDVAERALLRDPSQPVLHFELGRACLELDDSERAAKALDQALSRGLPPEHEHRARRLLRLASRPGLWRDSQCVETALAAGDLDAAFRAAVALVRSSRDVAEAWFLVGLVRHKRGQEQRAECALRRSLRLDDSLPDAHNRLGILLVSQGRLEDGIDHLERAHALAPTEPSPMLHLAQGLALAGRQEEAQRFVELAAKSGAAKDLVEAVRREIVSSRP
ncbi:MAG: tetratricopeptide repeat protein [bacterium]|nr:tetratricopeptide repeat protein [bacterium]